MPRSSSEDVKEEEGRGGGRGKKKKQQRTIFNKEYIPPIHSPSTGFLKKKWGISHTRTKPHGNV
jgi:hypothetical protein